MRNSPPSLPGSQAAADSPLDRALALMLTGERDAALRWSGAVVQQDPSMSSALILTCRLLADAGRTEAALEGLELGVRRAIDAGNLPLAVAAVADLRALGRDVSGWLDDIAAAFCADSPRLAEGDEAPPPPPLPSLGEIAPLSSFLTGPALLSKVTAIVHAASTAYDESHDSEAPLVAPLPLFSALKKEGAARPHQRLRDDHRAGGLLRHRARRRGGRGVHRRARRARGDPRPVVAREPGGRQWRDGRRRGRSVGGARAAHQRRALRRDGAPVAGAARGQRHRPSPVDLAPGAAHLARGGRRGAPRRGRRARGALPPAHGGQPGAHLAGAARGRQRVASGARRAAADAGLRARREDHLRGGRGERAAPHRLGRGRGRAPRGRRALRAGDARRGATSSAR